MKQVLRILGTLTLSLAITVTGAFPVLADTQSDFDEFLQDEFEETVEADYLTMHTSVYDYRKLGLEKPEVTLGDIDYEEFSDTVDEAEKTLKKLHKFNYEELSDSQKYDYKVLEFYLETIRDRYKYPNMDDMFRPYTGYLTNVTEFFADFPFYEKQDVEDYLTLIAEIPGYIDQMMEFTEQQAEQGYFLDEYSYQDEMTELNEFIEKGEENSMIVDFEANLDKFDGITEAEKEEYKARNRDLVLNEIIPAHKKVRSFLSEQRGARTAVGGLCDYPDGRDYYEALVRYNCSTDMTIEEIFEFLTKAAKEGNAYLTKLLKANPDFAEPATIEGLSDLDDILTYLQGHMEGFPECPETDYTPSYLPPGSNDFVMAYYMPAPVDNIKQNIIRVNKDNMSDINTMYYTLAHEGFPGHLYQFVWYQSQEDYRAIRHEVSIMGYQEGWACYVERIMLQRSGLDEMSAEYLALDEDLAYVLYSAADLAVNGMGYSADELGDWLEEVGFNPAIAEDLYNISLEMPGGYLPYGFGVAKFLSLRQRVEDALGEDFNEEEFHYQILNHGPRQFELVEEDLAAYVASKGKELPDDFTFFSSDMSKAGGGISMPLVIGILALILAAIVIALVMRNRKKATAAAVAENVTVENAVPDAVVTEVEVPKEEN